MPINTFTDIFSHLKSNTDIQTIAILNRPDALSVANAEGVRASIKKYGMTIVVDKMLSWSTGTSIVDTAKWAAVFADLPQVDLIVVNGGSTERVAVTDGLALAKTTPKAGKKTLKRKLTRFNQRIKY